MLRRERASRIAWIAAFVALLGFSAGTLEVDDALTQFMPSSEEAELAAISRQLIDSGLSRTMVLSVGGGNDSAGVAAAMGRYLESHTDVATVRAGLGDEHLEALHDLYFSRVAYFASDRPEDEIPGQLAPTALAGRAGDLKVELTGPAGALQARLAAQDPLGLFDRIVTRFRGAQPALRLTAGQFVSADGAHAFVFLETRASPFDSESQKRLLRDIEARFVEIDAEMGGGYRLEQSGVNRFAVDTERKMRSDIRFIAVVSLIGISTLFILVFRSPGTLLLALFPPLFGIAFATSVGLLTLSPLHGVTVGFGVALIGVAIDYPIHVLNHHMLVPGGSAAGTIRRLWPSLTLGALTTIASFLGLTFTTFPGIGEMGIFAAVGIAAALGATLFGLPLFIGSHTSPPRIQRAVAATLSHAITLFAARRRWLVAPVLVCSAVMALGLPRLAWEDDPAELSAIDPELASEDARVRARVSQFDAGRFVIAVADTRQSAIELNDIVHARLGTAIEAGELDAIRSLHAMLWSEKLQRRNVAVFRARADLETAIDTAFAAEGFRPGAFDPFALSISTPDALPAPLRFDDLATSPIGSAVRSMLVELGDRHAAITYLRGVRDPAALEARVADLSGTHYFDQQELMRELYSGYRRATLQVVALGTLLVFLVLLARYRRPRVAFAAFFPSVLVALTTVSLLSLAGIELDLLALVSLILVMGMGVDYSIFIIDSGSNRDHLGATGASLLFSCVTTLFAFGILAVSEQPALRSIGLTTGIGILLAFGLAPTSLLLARPRTDRSTL